jgi:hypothetical protein
MTLKLVNFKADPQDIEKWKRKAWEQRISFGEWVRRRLNAEPLAEAAKMITLSSVTSNGACDHRIPPGTWCKRCQQLKK